MRGRKPTPSATKKLRGNPGKRKTPKAEPQPAADQIPSCPDHLDEVARAEWDRVAAELYRLGLLTSIDRSALAAYCACYSRWVAAEKEIAARGLTATSGNGNSYQHPAVGVASSSLKQLKAFAAEFGMTPSARSRIETKPRGEEDELARWTGNQKRKPTDKPTKK